MENTISSKSFEVFSYAQRFFDKNYGKMGAVDDFLNHENFSSILEKRVSFLGIYDCLPFDTITQLEKIGLNNSNDIYMVELSQDSFRFFYKADSYNELFLNLKKVTNDSICPSKNYASLINAQPYAIFPYSNHEKDLKKRDSEILLYLAAYFSGINKIIPKNDYNELILIGGFGHEMAVRKLEKFIKINFYKTKEKFDNKF